MCLGMLGRFLSANLNDRGFSIEYPGEHLGMGGVLLRTSTMTVSQTGNFSHQALSCRGTGSLAHDPTLLTHTTSGVTTTPANLASGGGGGGGSILGGGGGKLPPLNQQVHLAAIKLVVNVKLSGVFQTSNTKLLQNPFLRAILGIFFV